MKRVIIITNQEVGKIFKNLRRKLNKKGLNPKGKRGAIFKDGKIVIYCNEKDKKRGKFLFKCCKGCKHYPFE